MNWLALDIGGANLKAADGRKFAISRSFPLWQKPNELNTAIERLIAEAPPCDRVAVTMTGELADCFRTKTEGVRFILDAAQTGAGRRELMVYLTDGRLVKPHVAVEQPLLAAASNWHALAQFSTRFIGDHAGLLIDIGSTTTDIIPLVNRCVVVAGRTDTDRLLSGELVYTGVERTPLCAVVDSLPYRERFCPIAREFFASMWDVFLVLGNLQEEPNARHTADGRPATKAEAVERLARMICADRESFTIDDATAAARYACDQQQQQIMTGLKQVLARGTTPPQAIILCGEGEFLARRVIDELNLGVRQLSLSAELGPALSRCAPAHALAVIATEGV